jgi:hypothetical protein
LETSTSPIVGVREPARDKVLRKESLTMVASGGIEPPTRGFSGDADHDLGSSTDSE